MPFSENIVTNYGAVADGAWAAATLTITSGTNTLASSTGLWSAGDVGKTIVVGEAGGSGPQGGSPLITTISGFTNSTHITLAANAANTLTALANTIVAWGTNNDTAFANFRTANAGGTGTLTIPNTGTGVYLVASGNAGGLFSGVRNITVNATGATIAGGTFQLGSAGQLGTSGHASRTASVNAGATSVFLSTLAETSRFTVGQYVLMTGFSLQYGGYPANHQRFEYVKIATVNAGTGEIGFSTSLVNSYLSTWPLYDASSLDYGGPATLYAFDPDFDFVCVLNGLTIAHHAQQGLVGRDITWNDVVAKGIYGPFPTMTASVVFNNCTCVDGTMEVDKYITAFTMTGCIWSGIAFQSADPMAFVFDSSVCTFTMNGTPYGTTIRNSSTVGTLVPGPSYGFPNSLTVSDSTVSNFGAATYHSSGHLIAGGNFSNNGINVDFTMSGGVIFISSNFYASGLIEQWTVTGCPLFFYDPNVGTIGIFTITDVTQDASGVYVHTNLTGGFPVRSYGVLGLWLLVQSAQVCTFTNVTGCPEVVDLSGAPAGAPLYSYTKRNYTGSVASGPVWQMYGKFKYMKVTVTTPYTGATSTVQATLNNSNNQPVKVSDYSNAPTFAPVIDLKTAGVRILDLTSGTYPKAWTGPGGSTDSLPTMTEALWCCSNFYMSMTDISAESSATWPAFTVEFITDQGITVDVPSGTRFNRNQGKITHHYSPGAWVYH